MFCLIFWIVKKTHTTNFKRITRKLVTCAPASKRGEWAERQVVFELVRAGINPKAIFHNLYIQKPNGEYSQVDVVVATKAGIIVFEVKNYSGWIFGNEYQRYWTQLLAHGKEKHRFYNPVKQNAAHIQTIRQRLLQNPCIPIYSVIVFYGSCEFKNVTFSSNNTYVIYPYNIREIVDKILEQPDAAYGNKYEIMSLFSEAVKNGNDSTIVESQIRSAAYHGRNKPVSTYKSFRAPLFRIKRFPRRKRIW